MKLHLLGTSGYHPTERRHTACLMLPEVGVVLDAGTGMFRLPNLLATDTLDIFLTHAHLDHVIGVTYLLGLLHDRTMKRVTVHALPEKLVAIQEHLLDENIFPAKLPCTFEPLLAESTPAGGGVLRHFPLEHPGGAIGFRLDWPGHSLAYVTDTIARGAKSPYLEHVRGVDLLVHECSFADSQSELAEMTGHSCPTPVGELARAAAVKQLVVTHCLPGIAFEQSMAALRAVFPAARLGEDQMVVEF